MLLTRRSFIVSTATLAATKLSFANSSRDARPLVGAIRWDAWYSPGSSATTAVELSLNPQQYRWRLPFFAKNEADKVHLPALSQALMDLEIKQAAYAGVDFWAFVAYRGDSSLSTALQAYLASRIRDQVLFCMFTSLEDWGTEQHPSELIQVHLNYMRESNYARVAGQRPLYFLGFIDKQKVARAWGTFDRLRQQITDFRLKAQAAGVGEPYLVLSGRLAELDHWSKLGADAITAYSIGNPKGPNSYSVLANTAEETWQTLSKAQLPVIPTAMVGWDRRPRVEHPVPWEKFQKQGSGLADYYDSPTSAELADHLKKAIEFTRSQSHRASPAVLIYAWNEHDEGGWLIPTVPCNEDRLRAVRSVTRQRTEDIDPGCLISPHP